MQQPLQQLNLPAAMAAGMQDVFATMVMLDIETGQPLPASVRSVPANLTSMLGLGGAVRGTLAIHCPAVVAKNITSAFLGMEVEELNSDVQDAIGELVNMVAGHLKIAFADAGLAIELAIPTTVVGDAFRLSGTAGATRLLLPFSLVAGEFWAELLFVLNN